MTASQPKHKRPRFVLRIAIPLLISILVVGVLFGQSFHPDAFRELSFTGRTFAGIALAMLAFSVQNFAMSLRFRRLSDNQISLRGGLRVQMMQEFTGVVTPSSVGGSSFIFLFLSGEGVNAGKATAITFSALFFDELFLFIASLLIFLLAPYSLFLGGAEIFGVGVRITFLVLTIGVGIWTLVLFVALFRRPQLIAFLIRRLFRLRLLRRYSHKAAALTHDLITASHEMRRKPFSRWMEIFLLTALTWSARFAIAIALVWGFSTINQGYFTAFLKQFIIWMTSLISPTPGASGLAEYMFQYYYESYFDTASIALVVAVIWRCFSAYIYLLLGGRTLSVKAPEMGIRTSKEHKAHTGIHFPLRKKKHSDA